jgi:hypothetical protein
MRWPAGAVPYELPFTLGHEVAGTVAGLGPGAEGVDVGDSVIVYGPWGCGRCTPCSVGGEHLCESPGPGGRGSGLGHDGGLAEYMIVPSPRLTGNVLAPSNNGVYPFGILVINSSFTAAANATSGGSTLGRAFDEGVAVGDAGTILNAYANQIASGVPYPNGQTVIRDSTIGAHINMTSPWDSAATTNRPYSSTPTITNTPLPTATPTSTPSATAAIEAIALCTRYGIKTGVNTQIHALSMQTLTPEEHARLG